MEALECEVDELLAECEALGATSNDRSKRQESTSNAAGGDAAKEEALALKNRQLEGELRSAYLRLEDADARVEAAQRREQVLEASDFPSSLLIFWLSFLPRLRLPALLLRENLVVVNQDPIHTLEPKKFKTIHQEATRRLAESDKSVIALEEEISALQSTSRSSTRPTRLDETQSPGGGIEFSPSPSPSADRAAILRLEDMVEMLLGEPRS